MCGQVASILGICIQASVCGGIQLARERRHLGNGCSGHTLTYSLRSTQTQQLTRCFYMCVSMSVSVFVFIIYRKSENFGRWSSEKRESKVKRRREDKAPRCW